MTSPNPLSPNPTSPMLDGRSPRIHLTLTIWTWLLTGLVLVEIRRLPPGLTVLLVPYLVLMARHWSIRPRQRDLGEPAMSLGNVAGSTPEGQPDEATDSRGSGGCSGDDDAPMTTVPRPTDEQTTPPSRRGRARQRTKAPEAEALPAAWVQIRPGRFVRVDEMAPGHPADESDGDGRPDEPHGAPPPDEPGATLMTGSVPANPDADVPESEVKAGRADRDAAEAIVPEDREIGEQPIPGSLATTYLIGCPSGDPDDPGSSPPTSGTRPEVGSDDRREDMFRTEMPEMDPGRDEPVDLTRRHEEQQAIRDQENEEDRGRH